MASRTHVANATTESCADTGDLRQGLADSGLSLAEVAALAGVSLRTLERYLSATALERGDVIPYPLQYTLEAVAYQHRPRRRRPGSGQGGLT